MSIKNWFRTLQQIKLIKILKGIFTLKHKLFLKLGNSIETMDKYLNSEILHTFLIIKQTKYRYMTYKIY